MNVKELQKKVKLLKDKKRELGVKESIINAFISAISDKDVDRFSEATNSFESIRLNLEALLGAIKEQSDNEVIEAINAQTKTLNVEKNSELVKQIEGLIVEVKKLDKEAFSQKKFDNVFGKGIEKIYNIIVDQNQIADKVTYARNKDGKITSVTETYGEKTIKSNWRYSSKGDLIEVTTKVL